jgi:hypothetical protein
MRPKQRRSARPATASLRSLKSAARRLTGGGSKTPPAVPVVALEPDVEDLPLEPLTPAFLVRNLGDLRVPTIALPAEVVTVDGRTARGRIFIPAASHNHDGAMRAEEWMNEQADFFPFLPDAASEPELLNRHEVLVLTVPAHADAGDLVPGMRLPERSVSIDCRGRRLSGTLVIDMPEEHSRVLDYLNRPGRFLTLRDGQRHHLIQKDRITRVQENRKE